MSIIQKWFKFASGGYDPITTAYVNGMVTKPSSAFITIIDKYFTKNKKTVNGVEYTTKQIIAKADVIYLGNINNSNDSFRNFVKNAHHGTIQGSGLVFDSYWGWNNPSLTGWVDTNYVPSTDAVNYTLNNAAVGAYLASKSNDTSGIYPFGGIGTGGRTTIRYGGTTTFYVNQGTTASGTLTHPFRSGLQMIRRTAAAVNANLNQNSPNNTGTTSSTSLTNVSLTLFKANGFGINYSEGINFYYAGASLTDDEFTALNLIVNEYLKECLYLKYGADNWGVKMAKSYFDTLHNFEPYEAWEIYEKIKRDQSDYVYTPLELYLNPTMIDTNGDGLANNWQIIGVGYDVIASIVTGNGFAGNAQRAVENNGNNRVGIYYDAAAHVAGKTYIISGKYRSNGTVAVRNTQTDAYGSLPINTGNAIAFSFIMTSTISGYPYFLTSIAEGSWLELGELSLKEVTESDIVTFNKCTNSGFGFGTDWVDSNADGLADGWVSGYAGQVNSIVTGNGFIGNAQRMLRTGSTGHIALYRSDVSLTVGSSYTMYFKYRSNIAWEVINSLGTTLLSVGINEGSAIIQSIVFTASSTNVTFRALTKADGSYIEIDEVCIIDNSNSQFYYNFFGPNGLNKTVCDYMMLFKAGGNLSSNAWTKTGVLLRWNQDGTITNSNTMPAKTRGADLGIVTVSSTDGWNGVTIVTLSQTATSVNSFYGNCPIVTKIKNTTKFNLAVHNNRFKINLNDWDVAGLLNGMNANSITPPGYFKCSISKLIGSSFTNSIVLSGSTVAIGSLSKVDGDVSTLTNIMNGGAQIYISNDLSIVGTLANLSLPNSLLYLQFSPTGMTGGTTTWNRLIQSLYVAGSLWNTQAILDQLTVQKNQFAITPPVNNLTDNFSGNSMGIVAANHQLILDITAQHAAVSKTFTCTTRTS